MIKIKLVRSNRKVQVKGGEPWKKSTLGFFPEKGQEDLKLCDQYFFIHTPVSLEWRFLPSGSSRKHIK